MSTVHVAPRPLDDGLHERISARLSRDDAGAIVDETLLYLWVVANYPGESLPPSTLVDDGWHAFLLYTREYEAYCLDEYGFKIHHCPGDAATAITGTAAGTAAFMRRHGIPYNAELWPDGDATPCINQCDTKRG